MKLTNKKIQTAKPGPTRLHDGRGLYIQANNSNTRYTLWKFKYRSPATGKENRYAIGRYPEVSLKDARDKTTELRGLIEQGIDPNAHKRSEQLKADALRTNSFQAVSERFTRTKELKASTLKKRGIVLRNYVYPEIGTTPVNELTTPTLVACLDKIVKVGRIEMANNARRIMNQVLRYAKQVGLVEQNPAADLVGVIPQRRVKHKAAETEPERLARVLRAIDKSSSGPIVKTALRIVPYLFQRPGEIVSMEWNELDLDKATWVIPKDKKKEHAGRDDDHLVPLPKQVVRLLKDLQLFTGGRRYVFSNLKDHAAHIPTDSLSKSLSKAGVCIKTEQSVHGFRATARTMLDEQLQERPDIIEHQLAHMVKDPLGRAYNRTRYIKERTAMMQKWADYLDGLKSKN